MSLVQVQSPYVIENLNADTFYEVYVEAGNTHGPGEPSERIIFKTMSQVIINLELNAAFLKLLLLLMDIPFGSRVTEWTLFFISFYP